ncbi:MAG: purine/pyrimidine permease [Bacteroides sp.]|nr:purine/pyrimidine permease [Bacteroides sp.]
MNYNINDKLPFGPNLLYGLQWWIVTVPAIITMGLVLGKIHYGADVVGQVFYMQKLFFVLGFTLLAQILYGHRLPLVVGPASVLLIGILASLSASLSAIYTAVMIGGLFLTILSVFGLLKYLRKIFTSRVIVVIMLLIPLTLGPTIINLVFNNHAPVLLNLFFVVVVCIVLLLTNNLLKGIWKSSTLILGIIVSTVVYNLIAGSPPVEVLENSEIAQQSFSLFISFEFDPGVILAFLFCAIGLTINEVGSIEAVGQMLSASSMEKRTQRGVGITGLSNIMAGMLGIIGSIDYSSSPGIIASTKCASRFPFIPTALLLIVCAFIPYLVELLLTIPDAVMGTILLYVMISQFAAGFQMLVQTKATVAFNEGAIVGLPLMIALLISFMPAGLSVQIPSLLRPVVCNGFVMGIITVLFLENIVYRKKKYE